MTYFKFFNSKSQKGFTLIELLVVMMIITVIYGALLRNQDSFYEKFQVDEKVDDLKEDMKTGFSEIKLLIQSKP